MNSMTGKSEKELPFSRVYQADGISHDGTHDRLVASAEERGAVAKELDLVSVSELALDFRLHRSGKDRFRLKGKLRAGVTQACVVSLDPVESNVAEEIDLELWPADQVERLEDTPGNEGMTVPLEGPEPVLNGMIDVGHLAYEHLAAALDPYPRAPGVSFEWEDPKARSGPEADENPFAKLRRLKHSSDADTD